MGTRTRLWAAAALCVLPLGFVWSGRVTSGYVAQVPIRVFLVAAAVGFLVCATRTRTALTRRIARVACLAAAAAAVLAAANGSARILLCLLAALAMVVPLVAAPRLRPGVLANHGRDG